MYRVPARLPLPRPMTGSGAVLRAHTLQRTRSWRGRLRQVALAGAAWCLGLAALAAIEVENHYTGSALPTENAVATAAVILVGSFAKYGSIEAEGPMVHRMTEVEVKVDKQLLGDPSDHFTVSLRVHGPSPVYPKGESDPHINSPYLIFLKNTPKDGLEVLKVMDTTEDLTKKVDEMITALGRRK
jgi:hypothetical protein